MLSVTGKIKFLRGFKNFLKNILTLESEVSNNSLYRQRCQISVVNNKLPIKQNKVFAFILNFYCIDSGRIFFNPAF